MSRIQNDVHVKAKSKKMNDLTLLNTTVVLTCCTLSQTYPIKPSNIYVETSNGFLLISKQQIMNKIVIISKPSFLYTDILWKIWIEVLISGNSEWKL